MTNDLSHATVLVSVPGDDAAKARALEGLRERRGIPAVTRGREDPDHADACPSSTSSSIAGLAARGRINELLNEIRREEASD